MSKKPKRIPNPPRKCIFCGCTGVSKEHIWESGWLRIFRKTLPIFQPWTLWCIERTKLKKEKTENRSAYSGTVKLVCRPCNNEWMSQLQNDAKPILLPLMNGERRALNRREQTILSAWITMFVMVAEFQVPDKVAIQPDARQRFKEALQPPEGTAIWLGMYTRQKWHGIMIRSSIASGPKRRHKCSQPTWHRSGHPTRPRRYRKP